MPNLSTEEIFAFANQKFLDAKNMYEKKQDQGFLRLCLYGPSGTGKTRALKHARKPVYVHQFDPSGVRITELKSLISSNDIIVNDQYESGTAEAYEKWSEEFEQMIQHDFFSSIGTYCIDSLTTWSMSLMNWILTHDPIEQKYNKTRIKTLGIRPVPELRDYGMMLSIGVEYLLAMCALNCDFVATAHTYIKQDKDGKELSRGLSLPGQFGDRAINIFPEKWITEVAETTTGQQYYYRVTPYQSYPASSRILLPEQKGENGRVDPNIKALLEKAGFDIKDKPNPLKGDKR